MPERAGILHSWAYIRQVQLGGQGSSEMVRHPSEQSRTFRSDTYDCLNVRSPFQVWCKCYAKVLVLSHSLNRVAVYDQWGVSCFSYVQQLCFFVSKSPVQAQSPLLSIVYRSLSAVVFVAVVFRVRVSWISASSAYSSVGRWTCDRRSFMKTRNRTGPRCEPWGTPAEMVC